jgi:co-chaperonin GroES (HSP10)
MNGRLLPLFVLAKKIEEKEQTEKGILIPTAVIKTPTVAAEVILTGGSTPTEEMHVKVGDRILFSPHAFRAFVHPEDKQEYLLVAQKDVMLIF